MPTGTTHDRATRDRVRRFVEVSLFSLVEIAKETGVSLSTIRCWTEKEGWTRPFASGGRLPYTPHRLEAVERLFMLGGAAADIAVLSGQAASSVYRTAAAKGWKREPLRPGTKPGEKAPLGTPPGETLRPVIAEIAAALRAGNLSPKEVDQAWHRASAIISADALAGRDPRAAANALGIVRLWRATNEMREADPSADEHHDSQRPDRSLPELRDEFYRHLVRIRAERGLDGDPFPTDAG